MKVPSRGDPFRVIDSSSGLAGVDLVVEFKVHFSLSAVHVVDR